MRSRFNGPRRRSGSFHSYSARGMLALACAVSIAASARATTPSDARLDIKTERVIVFKDGYSLILRRAAGVTDQSGRLYTDEVPDSAVLGSFWAMPKDGRLLSTIAGWEETKEIQKKQATCLQTIEILKANVGKKCSVQLPDESFLAGEIREVLTHETESTVDDRLRVALGLASEQTISSIITNSSSRAPSDEQTRSATGITGTYFVVRTGEGDVLLSAAEVRRLTIEEMVTTLPREITTTQRSKRLTFRFAEGGKKRELLIAYFRPGIRWIPTYRVDLTEPGAKDKTASIAMQAEILNEAEDLVDTPIDIVVGVPNFRFRSLPSPMILEQTLRNTLNQAAPQLMNQFDNNGLSNALFSQRAGEFRPNVAQPSAGEGGGGIELPAELTTAAAQELFVYNLDNLTLRKGERAAIPIFKTQASYRDVYTWDLRWKRDDIATAPSGSGVESPLKLSENNVWRQIELANTSGVPWTTGAAMIVQGNQPLAQELLTYTPAKGVVRVPITVAIDMRGGSSEEEIDRQLKTIDWDGHHYAKIQQRASLSLRNHKDHSVDVEIALRFGGRAEEASDDGRIILSPFRSDDWERYRGSPAVNNSSTVLWKTQLKPGATFAPTAVFHFFARH